MDFPVKYLPEWLPGMTFKKTARKWGQTLKEFAERPYAFTKAQKARYFLLKKYKKYTNAVKLMLS